MSLTEQQQRALEHAREVLAEDDQARKNFSSLGGVTDAEWRRALRMALADLVFAFGDDGGES